MFAGAGNPPTTVWTAIRPHNWRPTTNKEFLVEFDMVTGGTAIFLVVTAILIADHNSKVLGQEDKRLCTQQQCIMLSGITIGA
jgi:hypothetical protein